MALTQPQKPHCRSSLLSEPLSRQQRSGKRIVVAQSHRQSRTAYRGTTTPRLNLIEQHQFHPHTIRGEPFARAELEGGYMAGTPRNLTRVYDIVADGQRFLMLKAAVSDTTGAPAQIVVIQHFDEELKRLVPAK
jgi:hypothetical protein